MCVNHLIHRDYTELGAEVAINIYDNRIETTSPGGSKDAPELTPVDPFNTASYRRNPIVAEVFAQLKYMEKRGSGLKKIINTTSMLPTYKDDKKPYFRSSRLFFFTTIPNVNYGMNRTDLEAFADSKVPEPEYRPEDEIVIGKTYPINAETTQETEKQSRKRSEEPPNKSLTASSKTLDLHAKSSLRNLANQNLPSKSIWASCKLWSSSKGLEPTKTVTGKCRSRNRILMTIDRSFRRKTPDRRLSSQPLA